MPQRDRTSVQRDLLRAVLDVLGAEHRGGAIERVAEDGMTTRCRLNANLMRAARFEFDFEPCAAGPCAVGTRAECSIVQHGLLPERVVGADDFRLRLAIDLFQTIGPRSLRRLDATRDARP